MILMVPSLLSVPIRPPLADSTLRISPTSELELLVSDLLSDLPWRCSPCTREAALSALFWLLLLTPRLLVPVPALLPPLLLLLLEAPLLSPVMSWSMDLPPRESNLALAICRIWSILA